MMLSFMVGLGYDIVLKLSDGKCKSSRLKKIDLMN
jgi:hypothetical protein